ncbi:MAG TPA: DNA polymerase III subunit gamma/tau [Vitreimonas sp.]|nr:DNA polymerase III subunit gamma/tau [Vitreimonas sp.]
MTETSSATATAPHQALYRRWRAQTFAQIVGQDAVVETLRNAVRLDRVSHAILFVGPRGTGKTSLARILAKALNCTDLHDGDPCDRCASCDSIREGRAMDLVEIDAASNRGIDSIRELRERIHYAPTDLRRKVYILDEAHQITKDAWNALLKSLEEPPESVVFMFASTHPQEFPPAILSRLQRYDVRRLTVAQIEGKLGRILEADGRHAEPAAIRLIARLAAGGMRDAESMLDQLLASSTDGLDEARVRDLLGLAEADALDGFIAALVAGDAATGIRLLDGLEERGRDARVFLDQVIETLRAELIGSLTGTGGHPAPRLAAVARRLAAIDPNRAGTGGLRLQLELALFTDDPERVEPEANELMGVPPPGPAPTRARAGAHSEAPQEPSDAPQETASPGASMPAPATRSGNGNATAGPPRSAGAVPHKPTTQAPPPPQEPPPASDKGAAPAGPRQDPNDVSTSPDLDRLVVSWASIVSSVRPATRAVITECRPLSVEGNTVTLGFPEAKAFLKDVADRKRPDLEAAVGGFLGRSVAVRCVATNLDLLPPMPGDPDGAFVLAEARRIFADDLVDVGEVS